MAANPLKSRKVGHGIACVLVAFLLSAGGAVVLTKSHRRSGSEGSVRGAEGEAQAAMLSPRVDSVGVIDWPDLSRFSRVYALSDVHGMYPELLRLLLAGHIVDSQLNWIAGNSLLVVIGDSIDKGPQSIEVLQFWMALIPRAAQSGGMVLHLLGNHEAEFLSDPGDDRKAIEFKKELGEKGIPLGAVTDPSQPMGGFLRGMPLAARLGRWLFVHAGYFPNMSWSAFAQYAQELLSSGQYDNPFLIGSSSSLEAKDWWATGSWSRAWAERILADDGFMGVVFGHQPLGLNVGASCAISSDRRLIKIDNGMAPEAGSHPGSLLFFPRPGDLMGDQPPEVGMIRADGSVVQLPYEVAGAPAPNDD